MPGGLQLLVIMVLSCVPSSLRCLLDRLEDTYSRSRLDLVNLKMGLGIIRADFLVTLTLIGLWIMQVADCGCDPKNIESVRFVGL